LLRALRRAHGLVLRLRADPEDVNEIAHVLVLSPGPAPFHAGSPVPGRSSGRPPDIFLGPRVGPETGVGSVLGDRVVGIAVKPALTRLRGGDHGMIRRLRVLRRVAVRRVVAAARAPALLAGPQVDPLRSRLHAVLALAPLRALYRLDGLDVGAAGLGHRRS